MRILCEKSSAKHRYMQEGWRLVFESVGDTFTLWDITNKPPFDAFDESNPDVFIRMSEPSISITKCIHERSSLRTVDGRIFPPALDTFNYYPGEHKPELECDMAFVGSYTHEKGKIIIPLCDNYKVKIMGDSPWPVPEYLGRASVETVRNLYKSAKMCICMDHSSERYYQIVGCQGFLMAPPSVEEQKRKELLASTTYWHRAAAMMQSVGLEKHAKHILGVYDHVSKGL